MMAWKISEMSTSTRVFYIKLLIFVCKIVPLVKSRVRCLFKFQIFYPASKCPIQGLKLYCQNFSNSIFYVYTAAIFYVWDLSNGVFTKYVVIVPLPFTKMGPRKWQEWPEAANIFTISSVTCSKKVIPFSDCTALHRTALQRTALHSGQMFWIGWTLLINIYLLKPFWRLKQSVTTSTSTFPSAEARGSFGRGKVAC